MLMELWDALFGPLGWLRSSHHNTAHSRPTRQQAKLLNERVNERNKRMNVCIVTQWKLFGQCVFPPPFSNAQELGAFHCSVVPDLNCCAESP